MPYPYWDFLQDHTIAAALLLVGVILRARVGVIRRLFLPASFLAGGLGLLLGPNGLAWLPFSRSISTYPGLFVALIFATLPFTSSPRVKNDRSLAAIQLCLYSLVAIFLQWSLAIFFTSAVLRPLWRDLPPGFASLLAVGFVGGYGTAAAVAETFTAHGWTTGQSLAMMSATIGLLTSVSGGLLLIRRQSRTGQEVTGEQDAILQQELGTARRSLGISDSPTSVPVTPSSLNTLSFHLGIILLPTLLGYVVSQAASVYLKGYRIPVFCLSFLCAHILFRMVSVTGAANYVDRTTVQNLQETFVDFLVVFGIASISFRAITGDLVPLLLLLAFGIVLCLWFVIYLGPRLFSAFWFENALFTWGWITGISGIAVALLRIADPQHRSRVLQHFATAYAFVAPVEIALVIGGPLLLIQGREMLLAMGTGVASVALIFIAFRLRQGPEKVH